MKGEVLLKSELFFVVLSRDTVINRIMIINVLIIFLGCTVAIHYTL